MDHGRPQDRNIKRKRDDMEKQELVEPREDNPMGIPDAPPHNIIVIKGKTLADVVDEKDMDNMRKYVQVFLSYHTSKKTVKFYCTYDEVDKAYELQTEYPADVDISTQMYNDIVRTHSMILKAKPWSNPAVDSEGNPFSIVRVRIASHKCKFLPIKKTTLMIVEQEEDEEPIYIHSDASFAREAKRIKTDHPNKK